MIMFASNAMAITVFIDRNTGQEVNRIDDGNYDELGNDIYTIQMVGDSRPEYKVPSVNAPSISTGGNDMCKSGISGGINGGVASISIGTTITDDTCEKIKLSRQLYNLGMKTASVAILCSDARVFAAMWESGTICPVNGMIGQDAKEYWEQHPEERPDYDPEKHAKIVHGNV